MTAVCMMTTEYQNPGEKTTQSGSTRVDHPSSGARHTFLLQSRPSSVLPGHAGYMIVLPCEM